MSTQAEIDYEKQFQEDLAKATALSLEQEALDEYNRTKKYGPAYSQSAQQEAKNRQYAQIRRQHYARRDSSETSSSPQYGLSLPLANAQQPQRRHSEITHNAPTNTLLTDIERSKTPPASATPTENDLINFASPTSKKSESSSFEQLIEDLQKLQANSSQTALVPLGPTAAAPIYPSYHGATQAAPNAAMYAGSAAAVQPPAQYGVTTATGAAGLQLVPFTPPPQQQKIPLTNNELQKLYSMSPAPYSAPVYGGRPMGFVPTMPVTGYYPQTPPVMVGPGGPYTAPVQYPNPYGFQYNVVAPNHQQFYSANAAATSSYSISAAQNISHPQLNNVLNLADLSSSNSNLIHSKSMPSSSNTSSSVVSNGQNNLRRQTPPARKSKPTGLDLIDLSHEDE